jgi:RNA polymerase sigma-70 factor (ECF subfamily)
MAPPDKAEPAPLAAAHDVDLAAMARLGDRRAFSELVRRHGSAVRGLLRRMGAEAGLADRIARDAFLAAFEQIADFRGEVAFQAWVKQIAAHLCARQWRRDAKGRPILTEVAEPGCALDDTTPRPADLDAALRELPMGPRACVALCYGGGFSHAEAAAALKLPPATVKSHVGRGLDQLRRRLAPPRGGPQDLAPGRRVDG